MSAPAPLPDGPLRHRRCVVLRGERSAALDEAARLTAALADVVVLEGSRLARARARALLGRSLDAVVLDLHAGLSADTLGLCHGLVRGGGALILCMPPAGQPVVGAELAVYPYGREHVGARFWARLERELERWVAAGPAEPLSAPPPAPGGNDEQRAVVEHLAAAFVARSPRALALLAERGRGKSSALGLALTQALARAPLSVRVSAPTEEAALELLRFAPAESARSAFVQPSELLGPAASPDVIVVDEAAQLPVPLLRAICARHPRATLAFSTTTQGYEGTGRGFVLRFLEWLEREPRGCERLTLRAPIRWSEGDPLERFVYDVLALDAEVAPPRAPPRVGKPPAPRRVEQAELGRDEGLLRGVFGLLVGAHYRTTPSDLERLLDAPNLDVHAVIDDGRVLGATLVAREGGLPRADSEALARGEWRIRGHALADTLLVHAGKPEAGELALLRSVRIATHPGERQRGVARALVEHVHMSHAADLFGTVFGATPELIAFRRALGYEVARVGSALGASSGEPSVVMLRAASARGQALLSALRADLARNLPLQLELLAADCALGLEPALQAALAAGLPAPIALDPGAVLRAVEHFARGAQTMEAACHALERWLRAEPARLGRLPARDRALLERRVLARASWAESARAAGLDGVPAAMRAFRPAVRRLLEA